MSLSRIAVRRDTSEAGIIAALKAHGFSVQQLSGKDIPDLLIGKWGVTKVAEVKTGKAKLEEGQANWWAEWNGNPLILLRTVDDVHRLNRLWQTAPGLSNAA